MSKFKQIKPIFKTHKKNGHPSYIYAESDKEYKYIGLTHSNNTHGLNNIKLKNNPNKNDSRDSYALSFSTHDHKNRFKKKNLKGYKISDKDKRTISRIKKNLKFKKFVIIKIS